jgi:hypothetical protein
LRLPPQLAPNFIAIGNQSRGIARTTLPITSECAVPSRSAPSQSPAGH